MVAHAFNPRNGEAKAGNLFEFEVSLLYVEFQDSQGYKIKLSNNIKQTNNNNKIKPTYHSLSFRYLKCLGPEVVWISDSEIFVYTKWDILGIRSKSKHKDHECFICAFYIKLKGHFVKCFLQSLNCDFCPSYVAGVEISTSRHHVNSQIFKIWEHFWFVLFRISIISLCIPKAKIL